MQMLKEAISAERLDQARKLIEKEETPEARAATLDDKIRRKRERVAELEDRRAFAERHAL